MMSSLPWRRIALSAVLTLGAACNRGRAIELLDPAADNAKPGATREGGVGTGAMPDGAGASNPLPPGTKPFRVDATDQSGLDAGTLDRLKQGGGSCNTQVLYPYENTVFPNGLLSPTVMWSGTSEASYLRVRYEGSDLVDYQTATSASNPGQMRIEQSAWDEITRRSADSRLEITLSSLSNGSVSSCTLHWRIAPGVMTGAIYYNTYNHPDLAGQGAVMRLTLGQPEPEIYKSYAGGTTPLMGPCISCHSVSFDGTTIVANTHDYLNKTWRTDSHQVTSETQPSVRSSLTNATFGALTPDGTRMLAMGNPQCTAGADSFPRASNNMPLVDGPDVARLFDTASGQIVAATGLKQDWYMWMPQFSPEGKSVVFNHAKPDGSGGTDRRELAMMTYDPLGQVFSQLKILVSHLGPEPSLPYAPASALGGPLPSGSGGCTEGAVPDSPLPGVPGDTAALNPGACTGPCYPAWPFFTPDGKGVVFALISQPDFASALPGRDEPSKSELWYVDTRTLESVRLDNANRGLLPGDSLANYYPTVLPVQVGGYFWVFWTSTRDFGHTDPLAGGAAPIAPAGTPGLSPSYQLAPRKRIWVSALRPQGQAPASATRVDPSAPSFYLEGQGQTGNVRAFAALNPCRAAGSSCSSGLDCCAGYCDTGSGSTGSCVDEPPRSCAQVNDRCQVDSDCCQPSDDADPDNDADPERTCLGGYCGFLSLI